MCSSTIAKASTPTFSSGETGRINFNPQVKRSTLLSACNGNKKSAYGYKWKYVPLDTPTGEYHEVN